MMARLSELSERYEAMEIGTIGESVMGRSIPIVTLGRGEKSLLYVGAHSGTDWITSLIFLRYLEDFLSNHLNFPVTYN